METKENHKPERNGISEELRQKALNILSSGRHGMLTEVKKILRLEGMPYVSMRLIAKTLGITKDKLYYTLYCDVLLKEAEDGRLAEKKAQTEVFTSYTSTKLGFSIHFPKSWKVTTDQLSSELDNGYTPIDESSSTPLCAKDAYEALLKECRASVLGREEFKRIYAGDKKQAYKSFFRTCPGQPSDKVIEQEYLVLNLTAEDAYQRLMDNPETFIVDFDTFTVIYESDLRQKENDQKRATEIARMQSGLLQAFPQEAEEDTPQVEIVKLRLTRPMTPLELYELDKLPSYMVPSGSRPSQGIKVDSLMGVKYYFILNTPDNRAWDDLPKIFNVYLTDKNTGWIISCSCKTEAFVRYKPVFIRIIGSFKRTQTDKAKGPTNATL